MEFPTQPDLPEYQFVKPMSPKDFASPSTMNTPGSPSLDIPDYASPPMSATDSPSPTTPTFVNEGLPTPPDSEPESLGPPARVRRPPNAFILFRQKTCKSKAIGKDVEHDHRLISRISGRCWKGLPESEKAYWFKKAEEERIKHQRQNPNYRYTPHSRKNKKKRKVKRNGAEDVNRCSQIADLLLAGKSGPELQTALNEAGSGTPAPAKAKSSKKKGKAVKASAQTDFVATEPVEEASFMSFQETQGAACQSTLFPHVVPEPDIPQLNLDGAVYTPELTQSMSLTASPLSYEQNTPATQVDYAAPGYASAGPYSTAPSYALAPAPGYGPAFTNEYADSFMQGGYDGMQGGVQFCGQGSYMPMVYDRSTYGGQTYTPTISIQVAYEAEYPSYVDPTQMYAPDRNPDQFINY